MPPASALRVPGAALFLPAFLWAATLFGVLGFVVPPGPGSARNWIVLGAVVATVGVLHGALLALAAALARTQSGRPGVVLDALVAVFGGALYALLALSLAKFVKTHAHLNAVDLRFLSPSWEQVLGEGTQGERRLVAVALVTAVGAVTLLFVFLRLARRGRRAAVGVGRPLAVLGATLAMGGALVALESTARWAAAVLLPESALARLAAAAFRGDAPSAPARAASSMPLPAWRPESPATHTNLVVVMLESVPWKRLFGPEARLGSTPRLTRLAEESIVFERAYAPSPHSDYAQTALLAGLHPRHTDRHDFFRDLSYPRALPWDVLGPPGWRSGLFSTQNERWGNMLAFVQTPALGTLRHARDFPDAPHRGEGAETKIFEETAVIAFFRWLDEVDAQGASRQRLESEATPPFVAVLNFQATHFPYVWPGPETAALESFAPPFGIAPLDFDATFLGYPRERIPRLLDRFHNALAYADHWLGRVIDGLAARNLLDSTAIAVVADHGEAFYEHGVPTHGTTLHEEQIRVPMLVRLPPALAAKVGSPRVVAAPVATIDLVPTLYRALGLPRHPALQGRDDLLEPAFSAAGRSLFLTIQGMTNEDGILLDGWKWIVNRERGQGALFAVGVDPEERADRLRADPERAAALRGTLEAWIATQSAYYGSRRWERGEYPPRLP